MITKLVNKTLVTAFLAGGLTVGCSYDNQNSRELPGAKKESLQSENSEVFESIPAFVSQDDRFSTLLAAVGAAELVETLSGEGPFTLFAPTDEAFAALPEGTLENLLKPENKQMLVDILLYHVVAGEFPAGDVLSSSSIPSIYGQNLEVDADNVKIAGAKIIETDNITKNGIVHVIDKVLIPNMESDNTKEFDSIPAFVSQDDRFSTLLAAVGAAELVDTLSGNGPFTLFAPTDEAFAALPEGTLENLLKPENKQKLVDILLYHVVAGEFAAGDVLSSGSIPSIYGQNLNVDADNVKIAGAKIIETNNKTKNGIVHVIDTVLIPQDIISVASSAGFSTLVAAIEAAGLTETLKGEGPFTVFAPTDEAFAALPEGTLESLLMPENKHVLISILTYHVVPETCKLQMSYHHLHCKVYKDHRSQ